MSEYNNALIQMAEAAEILRRYGHLVLLDEYGQVHVGDKTFIQTKLDGNVWAVPGDSPLSKQGSLPGIEDVQIKREITRSEVSNG